MAIIVILIMIAFIMPSLLSQLAKPRIKGPEKAMWYFNNGREISYNDIGQAAKELSALRMLSADKFLLSQQDLRMVLLGQLIFPESIPAGTLDDELKSLVVRSRLRISPQQIDNFFVRTGESPELFWILLKAEAKEAGFVSSEQRAGEFLNVLIPKITKDKIDAGTLVRNVGQANQMTDDMVLGIFGNLLAVSGYARVATSAEDVTDAQVAVTTEMAAETLNAEFVQLSSEKFIDKTAEPGETETVAQFEKYKNYYPDTITEENPYGFGYKQGPAVAIDYMIIKLDDIKKLVTPPTEEEAEDFYQQNIKRFIEEVPQDANDPNSQTVERQKSYAEVSADIKTALLAQKTNTKAVKFLEDAVEQAQAGFESLNLETATVGQLKEKAVDYADAAKKIEQQNNIKIYAGKTALLTADEIVADRCLGTLMMRTTSRIPTELARIALASEQLGSEAVRLGPFEPPKPKMYVGFGPLMDGKGTIVAMARVIDTRNSMAPADINLRYEKNLPAVFEDEQQKKENVFDLKEKVRQDCRHLAAFKTAEHKAGEFAELAKDKGWDDAVKKFDSLYPVKDINEKPFEIQKWDKRGRISLADTEILKLDSSQSARAKLYIQATEISAKLLDKFYSLFKSNETQLENVPAVVEFKPLLAYYVVKSLSREPATTADYEQARQQVAFREDYIMSQSMAFEHFMPANIMKRLDVRPAHEPNNPGGKI